MKTLLLVCSLTAAMFAATAPLITNGPAVEFAGDQSTIITWTTNTGGNSVVHYGSNAQDLTETAESPNRWNPNLPYMVHRVLVARLSHNLLLRRGIDGGKEHGQPIHDAVERPSLSRDRARAHRVPLDPQCPRLIASASVP